MLALLTSRPRQLTCAHDEHQLSKSRIKLRYHKFLARLPQTTGRIASKIAGAQFHR